MDSSPLKIAGKKKTNTLWVVEVLEVAFVYRGEMVELKGGREGERKGGGGK